MLLAVTIGQGDAIGITLVVTLVVAAVAAARLHEKQGGRLDAAEAWIREAKVLISSLREHDKAATTARHQLELRIVGLEHGEADRSGVHEAST